LCCSLRLQGAKGVERGKGQLAKQQEKRKRAEDKALSPSKKKCALCPWMIM